MHSMREAPLHQIIGPLENRHNRQFKRPTPTRARGLSGAPLNAFFNRKTRGSADPCCGATRYTIRCLPVIITSAVVLARPMYELMCASCCYVNERSGVKCRAWLERDRSSRDFAGEPKAKSKTSNKSFFILFSNFPRLPLCWTSGQTIEPWSTLHFSKREPVTSSSISSRSLSCFCFCTWSGRGSTP